MSIISSQPAMKEVPVYLACSRVMPRIVNERNCRSERPCAAKSTQGRSGKPISPTWRYPTRSLLDALSQQTWSPIPRPSMTPPQKGFLPTLQLQRHNTETSGLHPSHSICSLLTYDMRSPRSPKLRLDPNNPFFPAAKIIFPARLTRKHISSPSPSPSPPSGTEQCRVDQRHCSQRQLDAVANLLTHGCVAWPGGRR